MRVPDQAIVLFLLMYRGDALVRKVCLVSGKCCEFLRHGEEDQKPIRIEGEAW